jgi:hypothetical protein
MDYKVSVSVGTYGSKEYTITFPFTLFTSRKNCKFKKGDRIINKDGTISVVKHVWKWNYILYPEGSTYEYKLSMGYIDENCWLADGLAGAVYGR